jgi:perosamine synthetase
MLGLSETLRNEVMADLKLQNIDSRPVFYPVHEMDFYQNGDYYRSIPCNTKLISQEGISLPTFIGLQEDDINFIAETLIMSLDKKRR